MGSLHKKTIMTKQEAIVKKESLQKEMAELDAIINAPDITPEERFWQIMNGCEIYTEKESPNSILFMKDGNLYFELENSTLWCSYINVWSVLKNEFTLEYNQIQSLIRNQVEERFKMKRITPCCLRMASRSLVEERFKMKGITPLMKGDINSNRWKNDLK